MAKHAARKTSYDLKWSFLPRIATEHLGSAKYSTSTKALCELVANALDAEATQVDLEIRENQLGSTDAIVISDNGRGITHQEMRDRFVVVGVQPTVHGRIMTRLGRFGVGRLAVHRIGTLSKWNSVSQEPKGKRTAIRFTLSAEELDTLKVQEEPVPPNTPLGTTIEIFNIRDTGPDRLTISRVSSDLLAHFCSYLIAHPSHKISIQGQALEINNIIESRDTDVISATEKVPEPAQLTHYLLRTSVENSRLPSHLIFSAKGRTVHNFNPDPIPLPQYLGIVECGYLDSIVTSGRELLIEMDDGFGELRSTALQRVAEYGERLKSKRATAFIQRARQEEYYPYRRTPDNPVVEVEKALYDVVLEKVHETVNLEAMTKKQQSVVFHLLKRAIENENVLEVLHEIAKLSDEDVQTFRAVLERTTLDSIIKLSAEVTSRLSFLDVLHKLVYGDTAKHLRERSQLHRIIEPHCWIFGPRFHLAASDQSFRTVIKKHRALAGLDEVDDQTISQVKNVADIPDLFLAATRDFPHSPKHHHVLVELKAPSVSLGGKEREQIRKYAKTILDSHEFDKQETRWDVFLVSAKATDDIELERNQKDKPHGCMWEWDRMTVWAFEWSEIITKAKEEMQLVVNHLQKKSQELSVSEYLRENFPDILQNVTAESKESEHAASDQQLDSK